MTEEAKDEHFNQLPQGGQVKDDRQDESEYENEHLAEEELRRLLGGSLSGERLVAVLTHLEDCSECQRKLPPVKTETMLKAVFGDKEVLAMDSECSDEHSSMRNGISIKEK